MEVVVIPAGGNKSRISIGLSEEDIRKIKRGQSLMIDLDNPVEGHGVLIFYWTGEEAPRGLNEEDT